MVATAHLGKVEMLLIKILTRTALESSDQMMHLPQLIKLLMSMALYKKEMNLVRFKLLSIVKLLLKRRKFRRRVMAAR